MQESKHSSKHCSAHDSALPEPDGKAVNLHSLPDSIKNAKQRARIQAFIKEIMAWLLVISGITLLVLLFTSLD